MPRAAEKVVSALCCWCWLAHYTCVGEVRHCQITSRSNGAIFALQLRRSIHFPLQMQNVQGQSFTSGSLYIDDHLQTRITAL